MFIQPETIQELHEHWRRTAFSWEEESASTSVITWFVDQFHQHLHSCWQPRIVRLYEDFDAWERTMRAAWNDVQLPGAPILFHIVLPVPPNTGPEIAAHVLLVQNPQDTLSSSVVTVFEASAEIARLSHQLAVTTHERLHLEHLVTGLGLAGRCLHPGAPSICEAWVGSIALRIGHPFPARDGTGTILQLRRRPNFQAQQAAQADDANLLQIGSQLHTGRERCLTHGQVAHTHGPPSGQPTTCAIKLIRASSDMPFLPDYVEVSQPPTSHYIQQELQAFGIHCKVLLLSNDCVALCLSLVDSSAAHRNDMAHFASLPQEEPWQAILHSMPYEKATEVEHMRHLYSLGFEKAVILKTLSCDFGFHEIHFKEASGTMQAKLKQPPVLPPWPQHQPKRPQGPMYQPDKVGTTPECSLACGITTDDLMAFFNSSKGTLCTSFENLDMPELCTQHFATLAHHCHFDRLVIYADGSSQARSRHISPQQNEETGTPDAWCFLVLGETYTSDSTSDISLIGWSAHHVRCDATQDWYVGADRIGSAIAEREALFWEMIWRVGQNSNIPTIFRSDSMLTLQQARGDIGALCCDESFQNLRGCAQLLESALAPGDFVLEHIPGHAGDPFNEFCDWGAQAEGRDGFFLPRPNFQLATWRPLLPYLWMIFGASVGAPQFRGTGFDISPAALPPEELPPTVKQGLSGQRILDFNIIIATGNVLSLGRGPVGFRGKLDYLRSQFKDLHLNFLGVQETRADAGSSLQEGILRLSSGADKGHGGVELWCNLQQPIAISKGKSICLARSHFTVVFHDSRRLLIRVLHDYFEAWFLVGYAPHSGYSAQDKEKWWKSTQDVVTNHVDHFTPLFVCIDANAGPGEPDGTHIFQPGFRTSTGTPFLKDFLTDLHLCAPITSAIHEGTTCTWTSPTQEEFTIDYVLIPAHWLHWCSRSCILEDFDLGNKVVDHAVHAVELKWQQTFSAFSSTGLSHLGFDRNRIQQHMPKAFQPFEIQAWSSDVERHLKCINEQLHSQMRRNCPRPKQGPKRPYIDEAIWKLRRQKLDHKAQLKHIRLLLRRETLARIFTAWKTQDDSHREASFCFGTTLRIGLLKHGLGLRRQAALLKQQISLSKSVALKEVISHFTQSTGASEIQQKLRPFMGSSNKLKQGLAPLPLIKDAQGQPCTSQTAAMNRWIEFFSEMEGGERVDEATQHKDPTLPCYAISTLKSRSQRCHLWLNWNRCVAKSRLGKHRGWIEFHLN